MTISKEKEAEILRYAHAEKWRVGTIVRQLGVHHTTVSRVLEHNGLPRAERACGSSIIDPYLSLITETLKKFPKLPASRLYAMTCERVLRHTLHEVSHNDLFGVRQPYQSYAKSGK